MTDQKEERQRTADTLIQQKINGAHREGFRQRFPGAIEHNMRLINERLQHCLSKPEGTDLADSATWPASAQDIAALTQSLWHLEQVRLNWPWE